MVTTRDIERYRQVIQEAVADLGREDMGVGDVRVAQHGVLAVEFRRGTHAGCPRDSGQRTAEPGECAPGGHEGDPAAE